MGLKATTILNAINRTKAPYITPKIELSLESFGLKMEQLVDDVATFNTKEIKLKDKIFDFLSWRGKNYRGLPRTGNPPLYTQEAREATESFARSGRIEKPLPNGFRIAYGPYRFNEDGTLSRVIANGGETLYLDLNGKGLKLMTKELKKIYAENPSITEEQKVRILHKFVDSCYDRSRVGDVIKFTPNFIKTENAAAVGEGIFIPIENTADAGVGVCRHKSFLAKALGDKLGLDVSIVRGWYTTYAELGIKDSHIWNEVKIGNKKFLMDVEQNRFEDLAKFPNFSDLYEYSHV